MKRLNLAVLVATVVSMLLCGCRPKQNKPEAAKPKINVSTNHAAGRAETAPADPAWINGIKLQGIGGTETRPFAIINGRTLEAGEAGRVKTAKTNVVIRCVAISNTSVVVMIEGLKGERKLYLN